jgi:hypothetical protein
MEKGTDISPEIYNILSTADWESLGKKMLARAIWRGSTRYRITSSTIFARGYSIEDVVSYIIQCAFDDNESKRKWNPNVCDLEEWLLNQVDSVMDWWLKLIENKNQTFEEFENVEQNENEEPGNTLLTELKIVLQYGSPDPETIVIKDFEEEEAKVLFNALFDELSGEPDLQEVILSMMDVDDPKPREIAEKLDIPVEEIYNRNKRLKRHLDKLMMAYGKGYHE